MPEARSENRRRHKSVLVRLDESEYALIKAIARNEAKGMATVLWEAFLARYAAEPRWAE